MEGKGEDIEAVGGLAVYVFRIWSAVGRRCRSVADHFTGGACQTRVEGWTGCKVQGAR